MIGWYSVIGRNTNIHLKDIFAENITQSVTKITENILNSLNIALEIIKKSFFKNEFFFKFKLTKISSKHL